MSKNFQYVFVEDRINVLYDAAASFVNQSSENARQEFNALFDFENKTLRADVHAKCEQAVAEKIHEANPDYPVDSADVQDFAEVSIGSFISWVERRNEEGEITWRELLNHLKSIPWEYSNFGIRIQRFGSVYYELHFNYMDATNTDYLKFYNAEYIEETDEHGEDIIVDTASFVGIPSKNIESIHMGCADLVYRVGLRDVTIKYTDGEQVFLRFSESN